MSYLSNYTITTDCLLQFFFIEQHSSSGGDIPGQRKFPPQLRVHSFQDNYDSIKLSNSGHFVAFVGEEGSGGEDPRFDATILLRPTDSEFVEAVVSISIKNKEGTPRVFLIRPDTIVPFMVNVYGSNNEEETAHTALVLHGVFKAGRRPGLWDLVVKYIFVGLGREP